MPGVEILRHGRITLVLGAGVSLEYQFPTWDELAKRMWSATFRKGASLWDVSEEHSPQALPQFLPMVFELCQHKLQERFVDQLQHHLYRDTRPLLRRELVDSDTTLAVLARFIVDEFENPERRLTRVITFNVDDLIETATRKLAGKQVIRTIARSAQHPNRMKDREPVPIYHVHGFVPRQRGPKSAGKSTLHDNFDHMLVFTDSQYWASNSTSLSFANRIMAAALHDSHCIFVGLSMTDINLLRWLALRYNELMSEAVEITRSRGEGGDQGIPHYRPNIDSGLRRHFWIHTSGADPSKTLSRFLEQRRGVNAVRIEGWGPHFQEWFSQWVACSDS